MDVRADRELLQTTQAELVNILGHLAIKNGLSITMTQSPRWKPNKFHRHCRNKPMLSPFNIAGCFCWIKETINHNFKKFLFTNETAFWVSKGGQKRCIQGPGEA